MWIRILIALLVVTALQVADYFITNSTYPLFDSVDTLMWYDYLAKKGEARDSDIMYVNVGLEKAVTPFTDEFGDTIGSVAITDRKTIADFLNLLEGSGYKYIFLDLRFDEGTQSENDSNLFAIMEKMPRLSFSLHRDSETFVPEELMKKGGYSDYRGNFKDGFIRYELLQDGNESTALKIYSELCGDKLEENHGFYFSNGALAYNMIFLPFYRNDAEYYGENGRVKYPYLTSQLLLNYTPEELREMAKGKIVVIGDFENDWHQTYMGDVAGPVLAVRAIQQLELRRHKFSWVCFAITSAIYFLILIYLLGDLDLNDKICKLLGIKSPLLGYIVSFIGWAFLLAIVKIALYAIFGIAFVVFIPALVFSTITYINGFLEFKKKSI